MKLLKDNRDVEELLIAYALFNINFERVVDHLKNVWMTLAKNPKQPTFSAGVLIMEVDKLLKSSGTMSPDDADVWDQMRGDLF